jgi:hypothetical protein
MVSGTEREGTDPQRRVIGFLQRRLFSSLEDLQGLGVDPEELDPPFPGKEAPEGKA